MQAIPATLAGIQAWLEQTIDHERAGTFRSIRLERIQAFLRQLPSPPRPLTVAGTKGKGSTVRLAEACLRAHGVPTLAFTSPHVASVLERWRIDGEVAAVARIAQACTAIAARPGADDLTYFERTFAVACLLAAERPGTAFLCEVGLGGRLDCANALDAAVVALTHLSHDHREVLGPTLTHIAREKLAIVRPDSDLVIAPQSPAAKAAIDAVLPPARTTIWVTPPATPYLLALPGAHQHGNAATAWAAVQRLRPGLSEERARAGMAAATLAARCQLVADPRHRRQVLVDGAHNGPSVAATVAVAQALLAPGFRLLLGLAREKEIEEILAALPSDLRVERCGYASARARGEGDWPDTARAWRWWPSVAAALDGVPGDCCVTGSFYLAGEALVALGAAGRIPG